MLPSTERVLELCGEVHELIVNMEYYAPRFSAIWLLILTEYTKNVTQLYEKVGSVLFFSIYRSSCQSP